MSKVLIIDNTLDKPWSLGRDFRKYLNLAKEIWVRRGPEQDYNIKDIKNFSHLILSGSRQSCLSDEMWILKLIELIQEASVYNIKILGICFGHQIIARSFGGVLGTAKNPEYGWIKILKKSDSDGLILKGLLNEFYSYASHCEEVIELPKEFKLVAQSETCLVQAIEHESKPIFGLQFHPEKSFLDGNRLLEEKKKEKGVLKNTIFSPNNAQSLFSEEVAKKIFDNFLNL
jgi:GMP synthase (glutamine-hydrolysing)